MKLMIITAAAGALALAACTPATEETAEDAAAVGTETTATAPADLTVPPDGTATPDTTGTVNPDGSTTPPGQTPPTLPPEPTDGSTPPTTPPPL